MVKVKIYIKIHEQHKLKCFVLDIEYNTGFIFQVFQVAAIIVICQVLVHPNTYDKESPYISSNHIMKGTKIHNNTIVNIQNLCFI